MLHTITHSATILLLMANLLSSSSVCPSGCNCETQGNGINVDCSNMRLRDIPLNIPENVRDLNLDNNQIEVLKTLSFSRFTLLRGLHLRSNRISHVAINAFVGLQSSLVELYLDHNNCTFIPNNSFSIFKRLAVLDLSYNQLKQFPELPPSLKEFDFSYNFGFSQHTYDDSSLKKLSELKKLSLHGLKLYFVNRLSHTLRQLVKLEDLGLSFNRLTSIPLNLPTKLKRLDLSNNQITKVRNNDFPIRNHVGFMDLSNNSLSSIESSAFKNFFELRELNISYNNNTQFNFSLPKKLNIFHGGNNQVDAIESILFSKALYLQDVFLSNNAIMHISNACFKNHNFLSTVHLSNNKLHYIPSFITNSNILLYLDYNYIKVIKNDSLSMMRNITLLSMQGNMLEEIEKIALCDLPRLRRINLSHNKITQCPTLDLVGLRGFDISYNRVTSIERATFNYTLALSSLILSNNNLRSVDQYAFQDMKLLQRLDLSANALDHLPFRFTTTLKVLNFSFNSLSTLNQDLTIQGLNVRSLYLNNNSIRYIHNNTFINLSRLTTLDLSGNLLSEIVFPLPQSIQRLLLAKNSLMKVMDKTFSRLNEIQELDLSNNKISFIMKPFLDIDLSVRRTSRNLFLNLSSNQLSSINEESLKPFLNTSWNKLTIEATDNQLRCNCLLRWVANQTRFNSNLKFIGKCSSPANFTNVSLTEMVPSEMTCQSPFIYFDPFTILVRVGETYTAHCKASGEPEPYYSWLINGTLNESNRLTHLFIDSHFDNRIYVHPNASLIFYGIERKDELPTYICVASNIRGIDYRPFKLKITDGEITGSRYLPLYSSTPIPENILTTVKDSAEDWHRKNKNSIHPKNKPSYPSFSTTTSTEFSIEDNSFLDPSQRPMGDSGDTDRTPKEIMSNVSGFKQPLVFIISIVFGFFGIFIFIIFILTVYVLSCKGKRHSKNCTTTASIPTNVVIKYQNKNEITPMLVASNKFYSQSDSSPKSKLFSETNGGVQHSQEDILNSIDEDDIETTTSHSLNKSPVFQSDDDYYQFQHSSSVEQNSEFSYLPTTLEMLEFCEKESVV